MDILNHTGSPLPCYPNIIAKIISHPIPHSKDYVISLSGNAPIGKIQKPKSIPKPFNGILFFGTILVSSYCNLDDSLTCG